MRARAGADARTGDARGDPPGRRLDAIAIDIKEDGLGGIDADGVDAVTVEIERERVGVLRETGEGGEGGGDGGGDCKIAPRIRWRQWICI